MAMPMTFIIITGGIDLSVGSTLAWRPSCSASPGTTRAGRSSWPSSWPCYRRCLRPGQRPVHHAGRPAAPDHDAGNAGALSRHGAGHQPGSFGARIPGLVLHPGPEELPGGPDEHPQPTARRGRWPSLPSAPPWPGRRSGGACTPSATTRPAARFAGFPWAQQADHLHAVGLLAAWQPGSSSRA